LTDVAFYRGRKPPRFLPSHMPVARLDDAYSHDDDWASKLCPAGTGLEPIEAVMAAIEAEKPFLDKTDAYVLDWMVKQDRALTQAAADIGMTKGGFSKRVRKLADRLQKRVRNEK
jgi:hypothetical protein